ncbi:MAG: head GIN domain-containing protein [Nitrososphaerales archaeon]
MSKLFPVLTGLLVVGMLAGCAFNPASVVTGSGRTTTQTYDFTGFTKVDIGSAFQTEITEGESYSVSVTIDDNLVEYLDVRVDGDTLHIGLKPILSLGFRNTTLEAKITMPDLAGLNLSGATRTHITGFSNTKSVSTEVSGASQLRGDITTGQMQLRASGASTVELTGATGPLDVEASGASTVRFDNFKSTDTQVRASGASNVTVNASGRLTGNASGASSISYVGSPASVQVDTSGASSVKQK